MYIFGRGPSQTWESWEKHGKTEEPRRPNGDDSHRPSRVDAQRRAERTGPRTHTRRTPKSLGVGPFGCDHDPSDSRPERPHRFSSVFGQESQSFSAAKPRELRKPQGRSGGSTEMLFEREKTKHPNRSAPPRSDLTYTALVLYIHLKGFENWIPRVENWIPRVVRQNLFLWASVFHNPNVHGETSEGQSDCSVFPQTPTGAASSCRGVRHGIAASDRSGNPKDSLGRDLFKSSSVGK